MSLSVSHNVNPALTEFESKPSNDLFLSIKPLLTTSTSMIPFQIRTQWKYTCWIKITVMFLAETRNDIEAGYHQRDTGLVGACGDAKVQPVFLPFMSPIGPGRTLAIRVFLNGFEISTQPANGVQSPYEVQLINPTFNQTGILVQLSTTTITQVNTVYISYFVFDATITQLQITSGYLEKFGIQGSTTQAIPPNGITSFKYLLYGLAGFIINQNYQPKICITVDNTLNLNVNGFNSIIAYVNVQFAVFGWNPCGSCLGYPLIYNGQCFSTCPAGTVPVNNGCVQCPINSMPSNGRCVCNQGYYNITGICTSCPAGSYFNGVNCVSCGANAVLTQTGCQCQQGYYNISGICSTCPQGQQWNGATCVNPCASQPGTVWNGQGCVCNQPGTVWNGQSCAVPLPRCGQAAYWNGQQCVCTQPGSFWNGQACQPQNPPTIQCGQNAYWNGQQCVCTQPTDSWNGQACTPNQPYPSPNPPAQCGPSAYWNGVTCICNIVGYQWTGFNCIMPQPSSCGQNSVWNGTTCVCFVSNSYWNGQGCVPALPPLPPAGPTGPGHRHHHQGSCSAGTFFDQPAQKCLPCTEGCISCTNCTECLNCGPGYSKVGLICKEICGDGLRFTLPCDDGNNIDGDGCSSICKVEAGYTCSGGSPNSKDICTFLRPQRIIMAQTGQTISTGKVSINVRLNWLPS